MTTHVDRTVPGSTRSITHLPNWKRNGAECDLARLVDIDVILDRYQLTENQLEALWLGMAK